MTKNTTETGRELSEQLSPGMEDMLNARYGQLLPGVTEGVADFAYGRRYTHPSLPLRVRYIATIAAVIALGGQAKPQLIVNIAGGRKPGLSQEEIAEVIGQMAFYGGIPAAINGLNAALEVFGKEDF